MHSRSAAPLKDQIQTATNEFLRRMRNTSRELPQDHLEEILQDYACDLRRGGYNNKWIRTCLDAASTGYGRKVKEEVEGRQPTINRPAHIGARGRRLKALIGRATWFQKSRKEDPRTTTNTSSRTTANRRQMTQPGKPESVLFVPHTPGGELRKLIQAEEDKVMGGARFGRVKVVERQGESIIHSLGNKAPWKSDPCGRDNCTPCGSKPGSCRKRNCTYTIQCNLCTTEEGRTSIYWGETHRTWWDRAQEHIKAIKTMDEAYPTVKHMMTQHPGRIPDFRMKYHSSWRTSLQRQIQEAIHIEETDPSSLMNSKAEWGANSVPRITVHQDRDKHLIMGGQCKRQEAAVSLEERQNKRPRRDASYNEGSMICQEQVARNPEAMDDHIQIPRTQHHQESKGPRKQDDRNVNRARNISVMSPDLHGSIGDRGSSCAKPGMIESNNL